MPSLISISPETARNNTHSRIVVIAEAVRDKIRNNFASEPLTCTVFLRPFIQSGSFAKSLSMKFRNFVISILLNSPKYSSWFSQSGLISHGSPCTLLRCVRRAQPSYPLAPNWCCNMLHGHRNHHRRCRLQSFCSRSLSWPPTDTGANEPYTPTSKTRMKRTNRSEENVEKKECKWTMEIHEFYGCANFELVFKWITRTHTHIYTIRRPHPRCTNSHLFKYMYIRDGDECTLLFPVSVSGIYNDFSLLTEHSSHWYGVENKRINRYMCVCRSAYGAHELPMREEHRVRASERHEGGDGAREKEKEAHQIKWEWESAHPAIRINLLRKKGN